MTLSYSISDTTNYEEVGIGVENPTTVFPAIYGNTSFGYTVTFSHLNGPIVGVTISSSPNYAPATILSTSSLRIARNTSIVIFATEQYDFVSFTQDFEKVIETLPSNQVGLAGEDSSVIKWRTPATRSASGSYTFVISHLDIATNTVVAETRTFGQTLVWSQFAGLTILQNLVTESRW